MFEIDITPVRSKFIDYYVSSTDELNKFLSMFTGIIQKSLEENKQYIHHNNSVADITDFVLHSYHNNVLNLLDDENPQRYETSYDRSMNKTVTVYTVGMYNFNVMSGALSDEFMTDYISAIIIKELTK